MEEIEIAVGSAHLLGALRQSARIAREENLPQTAAQLEQRVAEIEHMLASGRQVLVVARESKPW